MAEERDIPTTDVLVSEMETIAARLDRDYPDGTPVTPEAVMSELKNTFLPLLKDLATSISIDVMEIRDIVDPIKLTTPDAEEIESLLKAFAANHPTDVALKERIESALELLQPGDDVDDEDGDDGEDPEAN